MQLSPEQRRQFDEQGYPFFPNCYSESEITLLRAEVQRTLTGDRQAMRLKPTRGLTR